jgi:glutamate-5-semialdehyde dehydrogenase
MPRAKKDEALRAIAAGLRTRSAELLAANARDVESARAAGTSSAMIDRLTLDATRLEALARAVEEIAELPDPVGEIITKSTRPSGVSVSRVRVPLGVIAMIYESRPNVTAEASALALKAGNAIVLRGGSEARGSNMAIAAVIGDALESTGLPRDAAQVIPFTDRDAVRSLVQQSDYVDLAIPRGGESLIRFVTENARVPVVQHYKGVCHLFVDAGADVAMAERLVIDGKLSRPGVCNALECLLIDASDAARLLPPIAKALLAGGCELRGDARTRELVPEAIAAKELDWGHEFLDKVIAVRVVDGLEGALDHVGRYGSGHTESICTTNADHAARWRREVDAACVVVNASSRFHDGGELGLGAEIGIATSRLHWRGPMGLEALTTMKWILDGEGQTRA